MALSLLAAKKQRRGDERLRWIPPAGLASELRQQQPVAARGADLGSDGHRHGGDPASDEAADRRREGHDEGAKARDDVRGGVVQGRAEGLLWRVAVDARKRANDEASA